LDISIRWLLLGRVWCGIPLFSPSSTSVASQLSTKVMAIEMLVRTDSVLKKTGLVKDIQYRNEFIEEKVKDGQHADELSRICVVVCPRVIRSCKQPIWIQDLGRTSTYSRLFFFLSLAKTALTSTPSTSPPVIQILFLLLPLLCLFLTSVPLPLSPLPLLRTTHTT
jgi:hypothetical protein